MCKDLLELIEEMKRKDGKTLYHNSWVPITTLLTKHRHLLEVALSPHLYKVAIQLEVSSFRPAQNFKQGYLKR